ncbi:MAG: serine hydrolase [Novosphingobium sp.]|nr:serine hydrolase [Novosphingobium sp.]MCP5389510.1 serine hydrolase [Novosphingobium sp.]
MKRSVFRHIAAALAFAAALVAPAHARDGFESAFDQALGTDLRAPPSFKAVYSDPLVRTIAQIADGEGGRIGVAALDLSTGREISILGDQRFPMASTSKIAIAATFLEGVEKGRWSLTSEFPLMIPVRSEKYSSKVAPVRPGDYMQAIDLIEMMITRSSNPATDALLAVVGGPQAVNDWMRRAGIKEFRIDRDIATLVRDDGEFDPATHIDQRDSATPRAMIELISGLYSGRWLNAQSRSVILGAMERCRTGKRRIPALMPANVTVAHKTGSLNNTSSDVGIIRTTDGRAYAVAIYVTGQGTRLNREAKIASIARAIYDGYSTPQPGEGSGWVNARY